MEKDIGKVYRVLRLLRKCLHILFKLYFTLDIDSYSRGQKTFLVKMSFFLIEIGNDKYIRQVLPKWSMFRC